MLRRIIRDLWLSRLRRRLGSIGSGSFVPRDALLLTPNKIFIGRDVSFGNQIYLAASEGAAIEIGNGSAIAARVSITTATHDYAEFPARKVGSNAPVVIGQNVWIGLGAIVLPGVRIGDGAVVGAGAVVTRDVPAEALVVGIPGRVIRENLRGAS